MSKQLINGLREMKNRFTDLYNKYNEFKFGLNLISDKRKNYYYKLFLMSSSVITTGLYISYNTLFINQYKSVVHMYSCGDLATIDSSLEKFAKNVWNECNEKLEKSSDLISFFPSIGSEPISIGSLGMPSGAVVGLPHNFTYNTIEDVIIPDMRFIGEHNPTIKWRSEAGKALINSCVLSESAKKFAICRQIYLANNWYLFFDCLNISASTLIAIGLAQKLLKRTKLFRTISQRVVIRSLSLIFGFYVWITINRFINYYSSLRADKLAINLGDDYINGAIEYYRKLKTKNSAFYALVEDRGHQLYTEEGEVRGIWSSNLLTIGHRLDYFETQLRDKNH